MLRLANRKGFALPMSILVIAVLTAAIAAAFSSTNAEYTTNAAQRSENRAYNLAETGLERFMVLRSTTGFCDQGQAGRGSDDAGHLLHPLQGR
jgi:type II secretory pathway component PulK